MTRGPGDNDDISLFLVVYVSLFGIASLISPLAFGVELLAQIQGATVEILNASREKPSGIGVVTESTSTPFPSSWILTTAESVGDRGEVPISFRGKLFTAVVQYVDPQGDIARLHIPNISIDGAKPPFAGTKVGQTLFFLRSGRDAYRIQEERIIGVNDASNPPVFTISRSAVLPSGSGAFDSNGNLIGIATSRFALGNEGQALQVVVNAQVESKIDRVALAQIYLGFTTWNGALGPVASALLDSNLVVQSWLIKTPGKAGKPIYEEIYQTIDSAEYKKLNAENSKAAGAWLDDQLRPYALQFLASKGVQPTVVDVNAKPAETVLSCIVASPENYRGQILALRFSEATNTFTIQGRSAASVVFLPGVITAHIKDGPTTTVDRGTGRFSMQIDGRPLWSGNCDVGGTNKF